MSFQSFRFFNLVRSAPRVALRAALATCVPVGILFAGCGQPAPRGTEPVSVTSSSSQGAGAESDISTKQSALVTYQLTFQLPDRTSPNDFAVVANDIADLADRSSLRTPGGGYAKLASASAVTSSPVTTVGVNAHTGDITAKGSVFLRNDARVHGSLTMGGTLQKQERWTVDRTLTPNAALTYKPFSVTAVFPNTRLNPVMVEPSQTVPPPLAPAYYGGLSVKRDATVTLKAGKYYFDSFQIEPNGKLRIDDSAGQVFVYVKTTFDMKGIMSRVPTSGHPRLLVGYVGTNQAFLGATFRGTLLAPNAEINLATVGVAGHEGAFFGKKVTVAADTKITHRPFDFLIGGVTVDKPTPCPGETITVTVTASNPFDATQPPVVTINQAPTSRRLVQFPPTYTGRRAIVVSATASGVTESQLVFVDVQACPNGPERPDIFSEMNRYQDGVVELGIVNSTAYAGAGTVYRWTFGDGTTEDTPYPSITHAFTNALARDKEFSTFDVTVAVRRAGQADITAGNTVTIFNAYGRDKALGRIRPPAAPTAEKLTATGDGGVSIKNLEDEAVRFTSRRIDHQLCDGNAAPSYGTPVAIDVTIPARGSATHAFNVPSGTLSGVCAVAVHLSGATTSNQPASASTYLLVPGAAPGELHAVSKSILNYIALNGLAPNPQSISDDDVQRLARQDRIPIDVLTGQTMIPPGPIVTLQGPPPSGDPSGTPCTPGQTPPRPGLSCQLHEWTKDNVPMIANGLRGDVILSRSCGLVGGLLASVKQKWSHTGIITENYRRIRQSTGVDQYMQDHPNGAMGQPTDGFEEHALRYLWPGTLESDVRQAYETGIKLTDPDGVERDVRGFNHRAIRCPKEDNILVFPHVLKPSAAREQAVRPQLHQLADAARTIEGHYRFFSYSDASATNNPSPPAWVQSKPTHTVCSSLLWRAAKSIGMTVDADKSNNVGTGVLPTTPDGLYFYPESTRRTAANVLYKTLYDEVDQAVSAGAKDLADTLSTYGGEAGGLGWLVGHGLGRGLSQGLSWTSDIRDDVASQVVNCFASDFCSEDAKDSEDYKNPGDGTAVSPDDLLSWDFFAGHTEPLVYRTGQSIPSYQWKASAGTGTACGRVMLDGNPVADATVTFAATPFPDVSGVDGSFSFPGTPAGTYAMTASFFLGDETTGELLSKTVDFVVTPDPSTCVDIVLERPPIEFRKVRLLGSLFVHDEGDENGNTDGATELFVGASPSPNTESRLFMSKCAGDETRVEVRASATYVEAGSVRVDIDQRLYEGSCFLCSACNNDDRDGTKTTSFLLCDNSKTAADCTAQALAQGLSTSAVLTFTLTDFRVDNTDEDTGEFGRSTITITNLRQ